MEVRDAVHRRVWSATLHAAATGRRVVDSPQAGHLRTVLDRHGLRDEWNLQFAVLVLRLSATDLFGRINADILAALHVGIDDRVRTLDPTIRGSAASLCDQIRVLETRNPPSLHQLLIALLMPLVREVDRSLWAAVQMPEIVSVLGEAIAESAITARHILLNGRV